MLAFRPRRTRTLPRELNVFGMDGSKVSVVFDAKTDTFADIKARLSKVRTAHTQLAADLGA
jgi:hypothetical protein